MALLNTNKLGWKYKEARLGFFSGDYLTSTQVVVGVARTVPVHVQLVVPVHVRHVAIDVARAKNCPIPSTSPAILSKIACVNRLVAELFQEALPARCGQTLTRSGQGISCFPPSVILLCGGGKPIPLEAGCISQFDFTKKFKKKTGLDFIEPRESRVKGHKSQGSREQAQQEIT